LSPRDPHSALRRGLAFLARAQLPNGAFSAARLAPGRARELASTFTTAFVLDALLSARLPIGPLQERALDFLESEAEDGLWPFWSRDSLHRQTLPPDVDDTACALSALLAAGRPFPAEQTLRLLSVNRTEYGLYLTWLGDREDLDPGEADLTASFNVLYLLAQLGGRDPVAEATVSLMMSEDLIFRSSPYYPDAAVTLYCLARLIGAGGLANPAVVDFARQQVVRIARSTHSPWERLLMVNAALDLGMASGLGDLDRILADQLPEGGWPAERLFIEAPEVEYSSAAVATALGLRIVKLLSA